jgi:hypothetical protein
MKLVRAKIESVDLTEAAASAVDWTNQVQYFVPLDSFVSKSDGEVFGSLTELVQAVDLSSKPDIDLAVDENGRVEAALPLA